MLIEEMRKKLKMAVDAQLQDQEDKIELNRQSYAVQESSLQNLQE